MEPKEIANFYANYFYYDSHFIFGDNDKGQDLMPYMQIAQA